MKYQIILIITLFINLIKSDDLSCLGSLLLTLFQVPLAQTTQLCNPYTREVDTPDYYYKLSCSSGQNYLTQVAIKSKSLSTVSLSYTNLNCFSTLLSEVIFTNLKFSVDSFGTYTEKQVANRLFLHNCTFDQRLVSNGNLISQQTSLIELNINSYSNLLYVDFDQVKHLQSFKLLGSSDVTSYPQYSNNIDPNEATVSNFFQIVVSTNTIPKFNYIKSTNLILNLVNAGSVPNWGNLDTLQSIESLYLYFDQDINFPGSLEFTGIKSLHIGGSNDPNQIIIGKLKAPISALSLPQSIKTLAISDSPLFNLNGNLPFSSLPSTLTYISVGNLGLTSFPNTLPSNLEILVIGNNNFAINGPVSLPNLSQYSKLSTLHLVNCGYSSTVPDSYSIYQLYLNDNQLSGTWPAWAICYKDDYLESFTGNKDLVEGSCLKGSILPNVMEYNSVTGELKITGKNLGYYGAYIDNPALSFMVLVPHSSYSATWDTSNYGTLPDTLVVSFGYHQLTVATKILVPSIQNITKSGNKYTFSGRNFSYYKSDINVYIGGVQGVINYIDFYTIQLEFTNVLPVLGQDVESTIQNVFSNDIVKFTVNTIQDKTTTILPCDLDCNSAQGYGTCSSTLGRCVCLTPYYDGQLCKDISPFLSSASSTTTNGGVVNLYGWFGNTNMDFSVKIGNQNCIVLNHYINSTFANCTIGSGSGTLSITISENGRSYTAKDMFHYTELTFKCPKDCNLNGQCNTTIGQCKCYFGWGGYDCASKVSTDDIPSTTTTTTSGSYETPVPTLSPIEIPKSNTTINDTIGSAVINNQETTYEISILSLVEFDINNNIVYNHNLTNQWVIESTTNDNTYTFKQMIMETCTITYTIEDIKVPRDVEFAGIPLKLDVGIKITVQIESYPFKSSLNTLQLRIESSVGDNNSTKESNNECNNKETQADSTLLDKDQLLNYIVISRNKKNLYGRFINKALSDSRSTFITTSFISNTTLNNNDKQNFIYGINLPFFTTSLVIDPDFSVLVSPSFQKCTFSSGNNERQSWVIYVAIFVPVVFVATSIIVGSIVYSKNRTRILLAKEKYKISLKSLSKKNKDDLYLNS